MSGCGLSLSVPGATSLTRDTAIKYGKKVICCGVINKTTNTEKFLRTFSWLKTSVTICSVMVVQSLFFHFSVNFLMSWWFRDSTDYSLGILTHKSGLEKLSKPKFPNRLSSLQNSKSCWPNLTISQLGHWTYVLTIRSYASIDLFSWCPSGIAKCKLRTS